MMYVTENDILVFLFKNTPSLYTMGYCIKSCKDHSQWISMYSGIFTQKLPSTDSNFKSWLKLHLREILVMTWSWSLCLALFMWKPSMIFMTLILAWGKTGKICNLWFWKMFMQRLLSLLKAKTWGKNLRQKLEAEPT